MKQDKKVYDSMDEVADILISLKGLTLLEGSNPFCASDLKRKLMTKGRVVQSNMFGFKTTLIINDVIIAFLGSDSSDEGDSFKDKWVDRDVKYLVKVDYKGSFCDKVEVDICEWSNISINEEQQHIKKALKSFNVVFLDDLVDSKVDLVKKQVSDAVVIKTLEDLDGHFVMTDKVPYTLICSADAPSMYSAEVEDYKRIICNFISYGILLVLNASWVGFVLALLQETDILVNSTVTSINLSGVKPYVNKLPNNKVGI